MGDSKQQNWFKRHTATLVIVCLVIIVGLATGIFLLTTKHRATAQNHVSAQQEANNVTGSYKLAACKPGASQTLSNAGYIVGTDIAPGTYAVKDALTSAGQGTGWSNIDIYAKQSDFKAHNDGNATDYVEPNVGETDHATLKDGQYVSVWSDDAVFTCQ